MTCEEDGYRLWLRYNPLADSPLRDRYRHELAHVVFDAPSPLSPTLRAARRELERGLGGLLGTPPAFVAPGDAASARLIVGTPRTSKVIASLGLEAALSPLGREGSAIRRVVPDAQPSTVLAANEDIGVLYGVFHLLRHLQTQGDFDAIAADASPRLSYRILDHWDNLDGTIERGYAGFSIWDWHKLPDYVSPRYEDYARACASVGINGAALTNVNADARVLTPYYLRKVAALADVFRPYGIRVFLPARFSAPIEIGARTTADPLDRDVILFWKEKADEIYRLIPDFGGFVVKANSEGQPGPGDYGRTHAEGANVLADAMAPYGGIVLWRAFVYANDGREDRAKQAYIELKPLDGLFRDNVALQVKNGPIDFQPREPFHPLFGAMPNTALVPEFMLTQEYLGFATHLVYLATLFRETLDADTHAWGPGATVASVIQAGQGDPRDRGKGGRRRFTGMAGVANIGTDRNWCGHPFAQANWFAFGRLAWDPLLPAEDIADDWIRMTFTNDERFVRPVLSMMLASREAVVDYMTPLGLHHLMAWDHHYGPGPWICEGRADWTSVYYHRADAAGIGFDRSATGSNAVSQYAPAVRDLYGRLETCPEELLLWFHHLPWDRPMRSGRTLWEELCRHYAAGVKAVLGMQATWDSLEGLIDPTPYMHVKALLRVQEKEARWWRDACLLYFQTFSERPFPPGHEPPERTLDAYMAIHHHHVPGI